MQPDDPRHGERRGYLKGCRCEPCVRANAAYCKDYRNRAHKAGGAIRVSADAARQHIDLLLVHYTVSAIASLGQMNSSAICRIKNGQQAHLTADIERRILAIETGQNVGKQWVSPIGAARRVQALCVLGYAIHWQSGQLNYQKQNMLNLVHGHKPFITGAVDHRIRDLYDRLHLTPRGSEDRITAASITKAHNMAARNNWLPPFAWDDIDDPTERPKVGRGSLRQTGRPERLTALIEDFDFLVRNGESEETAALRIGVRLESFKDQRRRHERKAS